MRPKGTSKKVDIDTLPVKNEWNDFKKWWLKTGATDAKQNSEKPYEHHPLLTPAMAIRECVIVVVDIKSMKYIYTSPNYAEFTGWKEEEWRDGGVEFVFSRLPENDRAGVIIFSEIMNSYFGKLPAHQKSNYRAYWDFGIRNGADELLKCFQHDCALKYTGDQIDELLVFNSKVESVTDECQHLRVTNGEENLFYKYDHNLKRCIQLEILSQREIEIVKLIAKSKSLKGIAEALNISFNTVKVHHANALRKIQARGSMELVNILQTWALI